MGAFATDFRARAAESRADARNAGRGIFQPDTFRTAYSLLSAPHHLPPSSHFLPVRGIAHTNYHGKLVQEWKIGRWEDFTPVTKGKERPETGHAEAVHPALRRARVAARVAEENRGRDIVILDVRSETAMFDYFVVASGVSRRQLHAMSEEIDRVLQQELGDRRLDWKDTRRATGS